MIRRATLAVLVVLGIASGCAIDVDDAPRDITNEPQEEFAVDGIDQPTAAQGTGRIFLVAGGSSGQPSRIQSVTRDVDDDVDAASVALLAGPNDDDTAAGLRTAIPPGLQITGARRVGNAVVLDVTPELGELSGSSLILALAQIVYTFDTLEGVDAVSVTVEGEARSWPDGSGDLSTAPLSMFDYPGLERTSQPAYPALPDA